MSLVKLVLRRPVSVTLIILAIAVFGISSIPSFNLELIPDIDMPMMMVTTVYPGADPESVEELITKEVEDAGQTLSGVDSCLSYSYENYSIVALTYDYDQDMNDAYTDLSAALDALDLPDDAQDPIILQMDVNAMDTMTLSVTNNGSSDMMAYVDDTLVPELESLTGVASVSVSGGAENYIRVQLDESKLNQYGLSISTVASYIAAADYNIPAGSVSAGSQDISVSASDTFSSLQDLKNTTLTTATGSLITLADVADIYYATKDPDSISRYNGEDNITISIVKVQSAGTVQVTNAVSEKIEELEAEDGTVTFEVIYDSGEEIVSSLTSVAQTLVLGVIIAMIVLFLFFGDWKASLIVGSSMPLSVLATMVAMNLLGYSMNLITTGALVIAIGLIVDNSIVVLESCFRAKDDCDDYKEAALKGTGAVMMSIVASTITTIVVYVPLMFMSGMAGQMFGRLGFVIVFTLTASMISAICVVPLLFANFKPIEKKDSPVNHFLEWIKGGYDKLLRRIMYWRKTTLLVCVGLLVLSALLASTMKIELIPSSYDGSISITATFRSGTKLTEMDEAVADIEQMLSEDEEFDRYNLSISDNQAVFTAYAKDNTKRTSEDAVEYYIQELSQVTGMDILVEPTGGGSTMMSNYISDQTTVTLEGDDLDNVYEAAEMVEELMKNTEGVLHVSSDASATETVAHIVVDPLKAADAGLTSASVAADLYATLSGTTAATMEQDGEEYDIILNYPDGTYDDINALLNKTLTGQTGKSVVLSDIAHVEYDEQSQMIQRSDGKYQVTVSASLTQENGLIQSNAITSAAKELSYPDGVSVSSSFIEEMRDENLGALFTSLLAGGCLVLL
ncbi:MAG: efflux RND transporter permease subunit, partial [Clostridiales bacterium]|nr:efflux RND transporter permease subunit [Clostridiales bacterium]